MYRLVIDPAQKQNEQIQLTSSQQHYLQRVLRLGNGDRFVAMDGLGQIWLAQLGRTSAQILEPLQVSTELATAVTLIVALPKGSGFELVVRGCTELGVTTLMPILSDRTLLKPSTHKLERWRKIAQEAAEQSERQIVPVILEPTPFDQTLAAVDCQYCYICVARTESHLLHYLPTAPVREIVIATGPEGGWTPPEIERAIAAGFRPVSLGRRVLRAVTAPLVALSLVAALNEQSV